MSLLHMKDYYLEEVFLSKTKFSKANKVLALHLLTHMVFFGEIRVFLYFSGIGLFGRK
jgi:hypothetical protein